MNRYPENLATLKALLPAPFWVRYLRGGTARDGLATAPRHLAPALRPDIQQSFIVSVYYLGQVGIGRPWGDLSHASISHKESI